MSVPARQAPLVHPGWRMHHCEEPEAFRLRCAGKESALCSWLRPCRQAAMEEAGDADEREAWRKRLFYYLDWLFQRDANAGAEFAGLQARACDTS